MALPLLAGDGRVVVPAIHRFAWTKNKTRVPAQGRHRAANTYKMKNSLLITTRKQ
jgi:hypothetical protein